MVLLTFLIAAEFSPSAVDKSQPIPAARVERVRQLIESPLKIPRPKVKHSHASRTEAIKTTAFNPRQLIEAMRLEQDDFISDDITAAGSSAVWTGSAMPAGAVDFFSSKADSRRICFVVDCSGSMKGLFGRVKKELINSIESLQQDQYFGIIFFGGDRLLLFDNGRLIRASEKAQSQAVAFINSVEPQGQTNAAAAFEKLSHVHDGMNQRPSAVFFLTDGFELTKRDNDGFLRFVLASLRENLPKAKVNTIGFWPDENDGRLLREIAKRTGGEFTRIGGKED